MYVLITIAKTVDAEATAERSILWWFSVLQYGIGNSTVSSIVDDPALPSSECMIERWIVQAIESIVMAIRVDPRDAECAKRCTIVVFQALLGSTAPTDGDVCKLSDRAITLNDNEGTALCVDQYPGTLSCWTGCGETADEQQC